MTIPEMISAACFGASIVGVVQSACPKPAASNPDAELLALAAAFERIQREIDPLLARFFDLPVDAPEIGAVAAAETKFVEQQDEIVARARGISPKGVAGLCAKATIARGLYLRQQSDEIEQDLLNEEESFAWVLINNVLELQGRASA